MNRNGDGWKPDIAVGVAEHDTSATKGEPHTYLSLDDVIRLINCVRRDMPAVRDKPGLRESIDLLEALVRDGVWALTADVIDRYLCFLGKRHKELLNLRQGLARLEAAARRSDDEINEWVEWAFANEAYMLEEAA